MRITNSMLVSNFLGSLNSNLSRLEKLQGQMHSGKKYAHVSEDPVAVIYSRQANRRLSRLDIYKENTSTATNWLKAGEAGIMELNEIVKNAYESCIQAIPDTLGDTDRQNAAEYVGQLRDQLVQSLNSAFGSKYVFGGYNTPGYNVTTGTPPNETTTLTAPFKPDASGNLTFNGENVSTEYNSIPKNMITFDIGVGIELEVTVAGLDVAVYKTDSSGNYEDDLYNLLNSLYNTLKDPDSTADDISQHISKLQDAQSYLLGQAAVIGGKINRLELISSRYEQDELNYIQMLSDAEDADESEVIMKYKMAEAVYQASLSAGAAIIQPTLMDFLR